MKFPMFNKVGVSKKWFLPDRIAIDLGTANTVIYVKGEGIVLNEPSVVAVEVGTNKVVAVGSEAKAMLGRTPEGIKAVRPLKDGVIADVDVTEAMLRHFLTVVKKRHLFNLRPTLVVGVPSGITELEKRAVRSSASAAGAKEVYMIAEPMAAAIGVDLDVKAPRGNMVIDIGGGTTEIAVIALAGIVADSSIRIGGDEIDDTIIAYLRKNYNLFIGESTAEMVKMKIGSAMDLGTEVSMPVKGRDLVSGIPKTVIISESEVRTAIQEPINAIVEAVLRALNSTPPELASDIMDAGIVMTGGGALIKGLDFLIHQKTGLDIIVDTDPLSCVVRGAAKVTENLESYRPVLSL